jgi:hypothetical protein
MKRILPTDQKNQGHCSKLWAVIFFINALAGCTGKLKPEDLTIYINDPDNGLIQESKTGNLKIVITYKPVSLITDQQLKVEERTDMTAMRDSVNKIFSAYQYYTLKLSSEDNDVLYSRAGNFSENIKTFSFRLGHYVYMTTAMGDTIPLADFYTPNLYGMGKSTQVMLAFEKKESDTYTIHIKDFGLSSADQQFSFDSQDLENIENEIKNL